MLSMPLKLDALSTSVVLEDNQTSVPINTKQLNMQAGDYVITMYGEEKVLDQLSQNFETSFVLDVFTQGYARAP